MGERNKNGLSTVPVGKIKIYDLIHFSHGFERCSFLHAIGLHDDFYNIAVKQGLVQVENRTPVCICAEAFLDNRRVLKTAGSFPMRLYTPTNASWNAFASAVFQGGRLC